MQKQAHRGILARYDKLGFMRMKAFFSIVVSIVLVFLMSFTSLLHGTEKRAPPFTLQDVDGNTLSLSDFAGRIVVIDFWATWCHECEYVSAELERVYRRYKDKDVIILGISLDDGRGAVKKVKEFRDDHDLTYPLLMGNKKIARAYAIRGIPASYILDKNHIIVKRYMGALASLEDIISSQIEELL